VAFAMGLSASRLAAPATAIATTEADELRRFETVPDPFDESAEDLKAKVERLKAMLDERSQVDVDARRMQLAVQRQEEIDSEKMMTLLRQQDDVFATQLEEAKAEVEARIVVRMREEQDELAAQHMDNLQQLNTAYASELNAARAADQEAARAAAEEQIKQASATMANEHSRAMLAERQTQGSVLDALALDVEALHSVLSHDTAYKRCSHATHQLSAAVLSVDEALGGKAALQGGMVAHCRALPAIAKKLDDPLLNEVFAAAQLEKTTKPVPTLAQLTTRFEDVAAAGRRAALVPEGSGLWGYALASVVSAVSLKTSSEVVGGDAAVVFSNAEGMLAQGALLPAVTELKKLKGPPAATCAGWMQAAEERLLLEQTLRVAKAQASLGMSAMC